MSEPVKRRPYTSTLRAQQAAATRSRVLDAARALFLEQGYPATTVSQVAAAGGVAADTVLHIFGSKKGVLTAVLDVTVGGDEEDIAVLDREGPQAMRRETDQRRQIEMFARGITEQLERIRPLDDILRSAATVDADARTLRDDLQLRQRRAAMTQVVSWIAANGDLRSAITIEEATDIVWTITSPEVHQLFRQSCAWSSQRYQDWLNDSLVSGLLAADGRQGRNGRRT